MKQFVIHDSILYEYRGSKKHVRIPEGVRQIFYNAFAGCPGLVSLRLPDSLTVPPEFSAGPCFREYRIKKTNALFSVHGGILFSRDGHTLFSCPAGKAETCCNIPFSVTTLAPGAFRGCRRLETIVFSPSLRELHSGAFADTDLKDIIIPGDNPCFIKHENGIYSADGSRLYLYLSASAPSASLLPGLSEIGPYAFDGSSLISLAVPYTVTHIGHCAFRNCRRLRSLRLPGGLKKLGSSVFCLCRELRQLEIAPGGSFVIYRNGLYSDGFRELWWQSPYCPDLCVEVPRETRVIHTGAFFNSHALQAVLPEELRILEAGAFMGTGRIKEVFLESLPESIAPPFPPNSPVTIITHSHEVAEYAKGLGLKTAGTSAIDCNAFGEPDLTAGDSIAAGAFRGSSLRRAVIPDTIRSIGDFAFRESPCLTEVYIPASVSEIGLNPFLGCDGLREIKVSPDNRYYAANNGMLFDKDMTRLICCPQGKQGKELRLPGGLKTILPFAVCGMPEPEKVYIPADVTDIQLPFLADCPSVSEIIAAGNSFYTTSGGLLYASSAGEPCHTLLFCPPRHPEKSLTLPRGLRGIAAGACTLCCFEEISLPAGIEYIDSRAFAVCTELKEITIPSGVRFIAPEAFAGCHSLTSAKLKGIRTTVTPVSFTGCRALNRKSRLSILLHIRLSFFRFFIKNALRKIHISRL